jgi:uncharacterized protein (DUF1330 family)
MKTKATLTIAVLASMGGALGMTAVQAQQSPVPKRPAYYLSEFEVTDQEGIKPYSARVESTFAPFSGRYVVRGGNPQSLEGDAPKGRFVVIAFDSVETGASLVQLPRLCGN